MSNSDLSPLHDLSWVVRSLGASRSTVYRMRRSDPDFPKPYLVNKSEKWTERQIVHYREILRQRAAGERPIPSYLQPARPEMAAE